MARGGISFLGIGAQNATMKACDDVKSVVASNGADAVKGLAVTVTGNGEAGLGSKGDPLFGVIRKYEEDGHVTVQFAGFAEVNGVSGSLPTAGTDFFAVVNGDGAIRASASGKSGKIVSVSDDATGPIVVLLG